MKKLLFILILFASCKKEKLNQNSNRNVDVTYVFTCPHYTGSLKMNFNGNETQTVTSGNSFTFTRTENILYVNCPETIGANCVLQTDLTDSCKAEIYIGGHLKATGNTNGGTYISYQYNW